MSPPPSGNVQPFQIAPVQTPDPLQTLAQMQEMRTRNLQQQQAQMGLQQQAMQLRSNQAMMKAFAQGNGDWDTTQKLLDSSPDILPTDRMAVEQHRLQLQTEAATLREKDIQNFTADTDRYRGFLDGVKNQDDLDQANLKAEQAGISSKVQRLTTFPGDAEHVKSFSAGLGLHSQIVSEAKTRAETTEAEQKGAEAQAAAKKAAAETDILQNKQRLYNIFTKSQQALNEWVDASIPPDKFPAANAAAKNEMRYAGDLDKMNEILQKYSASPVSAESEKVQMPTKVEQARQTAQVTAPIETAKSVATALQTERAKGGMLPAPWSGLDPTTGREGLNKSLALDEAYTKKMAAAQNTLNTITAAQKGNQRAASFITIEQLKSQLNRVTNTEIAATDTGASLIRNIQNDISRKFQGRPYSETLKDSIALANLEKIAAENEYAGGQTALSSNYKVGPLPHATLPRGVSPAPGGGPPPIPASVPAQYRGTAHYSAKTKSYYYSTDGGKSWVQVPLQ